MSSFGMLHERVDRRPHPGGRKGSMMSLDEVARRAWAARGLPRVRAWTTQQLAAAGNPNGRRSQVQAIVSAYRRKVPYVPDPVMVEFMAGPEQILCLDPDKLCIVGADCDEAAITCLACCYSVGILPLWVVGASYDKPDVPTHVYFAFADDLGERVEVDPTTQMSVGNVHPAVRKWWIDPMKGIDPSGLSGGEFVGVAGPPSRVANDNAIFFRGRRVNGLQ